MRLFAAFLVPVLLASSGCFGGDKSADDSQASTDDSQATTDDSQSTDDSPVDTEPEFDGAALFAEHCARCHGEDGHGGRNGPDLRPEMRLSDEQIIEIILNGERDMPAIEVTEPEAQAIVDWLRANL